MDCKHFHFFSTKYSSNQWQLDGNRVYYTKVHPVSTVCWQSRSSCLACTWEVERSNQSNNDHVLDMFIQVFLSTNVDHFVTLNSSQTFKPQFFFCP